MKKLAILSLFMIPFTTIFGQETSIDKRSDNEIPALHLSVYSGIWIPQDDAVILGCHPVIGVEAGLSGPKLAIDLIYDLKFLCSPNDYTVKYQDSLLTTNYYLGMYLGLGLETRIYRFRRHEFVYLAAIGVESIGFKEMGEDEKFLETLDRKLYSFNVNTGLAYRFYINYKSYIAIKARYNFIEFKNKGGTLLLGNALSLTLAFGLFQH